MKEAGQTAYEARFSQCVTGDRILPWADLPPEARDVWVEVESAVLAGAHRLQIVEEAWDENLSRSSITVVGTSAPAGLGANGAIVLQSEITPVDRQRLTPPSADAVVLMGVDFGVNIDPRTGQALASGFSGNACRDCGAFAMVRTGTCETCQSCGSTSGGCS